MTWERGQKVSYRSMSLLAINHKDKGEPPVSNKFMKWIIDSHRFAIRQDWRVDVESSEMRDEIGLSKYLDPGDEDLTSEELGTRIDECLVDYIEIYTGCLTTGGISLEEFESAMGKIERGKKWDVACQAHSDRLYRRNLRPANETYLGLARRDARDALYGGQRRSSLALGRDFALVYMDYIRKRDRWKIEWDRKTVTKCLVDGYLGDPDPVVLQRLIVNSEESPLAWDMLYSICRELGFAGVYPPIKLFIWYVKATNGYPCRPDEIPNLPNRPRYLGLRLRDNEIRHTVNLLTLVGIKEIDGCSAVADALGLKKITVHRKYKESNWEMLDLAAHAIERLDPSFCLSPREIWPRLRPYFFRISRNQPLPALSIGRRKEQFRFASTPSTSSMPRTILLKSVEVATYPGGSTAPSVEAREAQ